MALGISLITKSNLGTSPISSVPFVLSLKFNPSFGWFTFIISSFFILLEIILLRKEFPRKQYLQIFVTLLLGLFIDFSMALLSFVKPDLYVQKILVLLTGCTVLAFGIHIQLRADVLINSGEGLVRAIAQKTGKPFGNIKIIFDLTLAGSACIISLFEFGMIKGLREGTLISAILVGFLTKFFGNIGYRWGQ
ncbi:membrane protein [Spirochaetia bacterium]|nr:membrane protein [Spirochaetia bacterium]